LCTAHLGFRDRASKTITLFETGRLTVSTVCVPVKELFTKNTVNETHIMLVIKINLFLLKIIIIKNTPIIIYEVFLLIIPLLILYAYF